MDVRSSQFHQDIRPCVFKGKYLIAAIFCTVILNCAGLKIVESAVAQEQPTRFESWERCQAQCQIRLLEAELVCGENLVVCLNNIVDSPLAWLNFEASQTFCERSYSICMLTADNRQEICLQGCHNEMTMQAHEEASAAIAETRDILRSTAELYEAATPQSR